MKGSNGKEGLVVCVKSMRDLRSVLLQIQISYQINESYHGILTEISLKIGVGSYLGGLYETSVGSLALMLR
ncbi:hypothetical protein C5167_031787 [Papaver somniferum]|uniref:Uncharacterized protein n=1 Tax=Papaver somniferum TaxID=3469 RepID=A0A4Y7K8A4_PAPSO|nr:hypothetical protein C5167_031787 [Papaver somniferum]